MPTEIRVPALGESIAEATISTWLKHEGETVEVGEALLELETDKVNLEVAAEHAGVLVSITRQAGDTVAIGDILGTIGETGSSSTPAPPAGEDTATPSITLSSPPSSPALSPPPPSNIADTPSTTSSQEGAATATHATPVAQRMAHENALDIQQVAGSGPSGRVTKGDVISHMHDKQPPLPPSQPPQPPASDGERSSPPPPPPAADEQRPEERVRMSRRRQTIAARLLEAQRTAAMLTTFNEIDMGAVMELRQQRKETFKERHNVGLGFMSFFVKATIGALKSFPLLNAEIQGDEIVIKRYYDIGIAVGTEQGLVVPVLRNASNKTFAEIEQGIVDLAERARANTLSLADLQGGTFSITNGGVYGSLMSTPILNTPQVGILGLHKIEQRPVAIRGEVHIRPMMYVALSYDHRIVDGSEAVRFLVRVKELTEDPTTLLLEG
jgi:2-oxoglutarate dehydrogenase E2 component (dihydrolipoamide succinyltransferase)